LATVWVVVSIVVNNIAYRIPDNTDAEVPFVQWATGHILGVLWWPTRWPVLGYFTEFALPTTAPTITTVFVIKGIVWCAVLATAMRVLRRQLRSLRVGDRTVRWISVMGSTTVIILASGTLLALTLGSPLPGWAGGWTYEEACSNGFSHIYGPCECRRHSAGRLIEMECRPRKWGFSARYTNPSPTDLDHARQQWGASSPLSRSW
jgi:hypothetical protein